MTPRSIKAVLLAVLAPLGAAAQAPHPVDPPQAAEEAAPEPTREERLDSLFENLADGTENEAAIAMRRISELWAMSGSDSMDLLLRRGREAIEAENYDKALDHLSALVEFAPDFAEGWNARATAHYLAEEYWAAVSDILHVLSLEPRHFGALTGLGVILERTGDEAGALRAQREALRLNPHMEGARDAVERLEPKVDGRDI